MTTTQEYKYFTFEGLNKAYNMNTNTEMSNEEFGEHLEANNLPFMHIFCETDSVEEAIEEEQYNSEDFNYFNVGGTYYFAVRK